MKICLPICFGYRIKRFLLGSDTACRVLIVESWYRDSTYGDFLVNLDDDLTEKIPTSLVRDQDPEVRTLCNT